MNNSSSQGKWIPVSDNLPKENQDCLFTLYSPAYHDITDRLPEDERDFSEEITSVIGRVFIYKNKRYWQRMDETGITSGRGTIENEYSKEYTGRETYVTAWMPLPSPYHVGMNEK